MNSPLSDFSDQDFPKKNHPATDLSWSQLSGIPREEIFLAGKLSTGCPACRSAVPWASKQNADRLNGDHVSLHVTFTVHTHIYMCVMCFIWHTMCICVTSHAICVTCNVYNWFYLCVIYICKCSCLHAKLYQHICCRLIWDAVKHCNVITRR